MTKKDYILIAKVLRDNYNGLDDPISEHDFIMLINDFISMLKRDNPLFNEDTFKKAIYK